MNEYLKYSHLRTDPFLRLMPSAANGCNGINLSRYPVLPKLASYKMYEHWRLFADFLYKKMSILVNIC